MKKTSLILFLVCIMSGGVFAALDVWVGPVGNWNEDAKWHDGGPSTWGVGDGEIKITPNDADVTVNDTQQWLLVDLKVASANATVRIDDGAVFTVDRAYFGDAGLTANGTVGNLIQTGGSFTVDELYIGNNGVCYGYYTISGGSLNVPNKARVGAGSNDNGTVGTFTVIGNDASISVKRLDVGSEDGTRYGTGTLEFQIGPEGVSAIGATSEVNLDRAGAISTTNLVVNTTESSLPEEDIVLVNLTDSGDVDGRFDTVNGTIPAVEGAQVVLGGNTYTLTYTYNAAPDLSHYNDVALVFGGGAEPTTAHTPNPENGETVYYLTLSLLDWENPEPNNPGDPLYCDVYLGTEPNRLGAMDRVTLGSDISEVEIDTTNFPTYGDLLNDTTYYWFVDVNDVGVLIEGPQWNFSTSDNEAPIVDAGPDQIVWLGKSGTAGQELVQLDGTVSDDGSYTVQWSQIVNGAPLVTIVTTDIEDPNVTFTARGDYEFTLTADDGIGAPVSDTVRIVVGDDSCDASHIDSGAAYDAGDANQDCIVDLADFVELIASSWLNCTNTEEGCD
jgi:hypothetical protein